MNFKPRQLLSIIVAVLWLSVVTVAYYTVHKPFELANGLALANTLGDSLTALALYVLAMALGARLLRRFEFTALETIVWSTGLGLGMVALATFALGLIGVLNPIIFWLAVLILLALLHRELIRMWRITRAIDLGLTNRIDRALAFYIALVLLLGLALALLPPTLWDTLQYHLVGPRLAIEQGRITVPPDNLSLSNPALVEMLFLATMVMKSDSAAQLMHLGYLVLMLGALIVFCQRYFTARIGWLASAFLVSVWTLWLSAITAYNDAALMFYGFAALSVALIARKPSPPSPLPSNGGASVPERSEGRTGMGVALAGVFVGFALGEKYTAAFIVVAVTLLILRPNRAALIQTLVFGACAAVIASPWYLRNWIFVGNPIYPFIWGGLYWDAFRANWYSRLGTGLLTRLFDLLLAPWDATIGGRGDLDYQGTIGPLLLALVPLQILAARFAPRAERKEFTRALWLYCLVLYLPWLWGVASSKLLWQIRLLLPAFPALSILAAEAVDRLAAFKLPSFSIQRFTAFVIGLVLALTLVSYTLFTLGASPFGYFVGAESRAQYLERALGDYNRMTQFVNTNLPRDAKVLLLWETRAYYIERRVSADAILDKWGHYRHLYQNADAIADAWRREGYTHVVLYRAGLDFMLQTGYDPVTLNDAQVLQDLITRHLRQIYGSVPFQVITRDGRPGVASADSEPYAVYELK